MFGAAGTLANVSMRAQNQGKVNYEFLTEAFETDLIHMTLASSVLRRCLGHHDDGSGQVIDRT